MPCSRPSLRKTESRPNRRIRGKPPEIIASFRVIAISRPPRDQAVYRQRVLVKVPQQDKKDQRIDELDSHRVIFFDKRAAEDQEDHPDSSKSQPGPRCEAE